MNKEKVLKIILMASIPVMLLIWGKSCGCFPNRTAAPKGQASGGGQGGGEAGEPAILGKRQARHTKYTTWGRPPFHAGQLASSALAPLTLEGIVTDPLVPTAIINGEITKEGDVIADATVVLIQKRKVVLKKDKQEIVLELFEQ